MHVKIYAITGQRLKLRCEVGEQHFIVILLFSDSIGQHCKCIWIWVSNGSFFLDSRSQVYECSLWIRTMDTRKMWIWNDLLHNVLLWLLLYRNVIMLRRIISWLIFINFFLLYFADETFYLDIACSSSQLLPTWDLLPRRRSSALLIVCSRRFAESQCIISRQLNRP